MLGLPGLILDTCISGTGQADSQDHLNLKKAHWLLPYSVTSGDDQVRINVNLVLKVVHFNFSLDETPWLV